MTWPSAGQRHARLPAVGRVVAADDDVGAEDDGEGVVGRGAGTTTAVVPGVTSVSAATAAVATGLCRHEDTLTILPGTLPVPELARRLADTDAAIVMKLGQTFPGVVEAVRAFWPAGSDSRGSSRGTRRAG